jgi:hypothetical protein
LEWTCMKEQGKGGEILFSASLRDGLAGSIPKAVAKASLGGTRGRGTGRGRCLWTFGR